MHINKDDVAVCLAWAIFWAVKDLEIKPEGHAPRAIICCMAMVMVKDRPVQIGPIHICFCPELSAANAI